SVTKLYTVKVERFAGRKSFGYLPKHDDAKGVNWRVVFDSKSSSLNFSDMPSVALYMQFTSAGKRNEIYSIQLLHA
ncbi:MAG TPA: hypothetical protein VER98_05360, partial [Terriglobia bacterium]|nr:hypothetical protein [Terriglobia bacterium]